MLPQLPDPMMATECWRDDETWPLAPAPAPPAPAAPSSPPPDTLDDIGASNEASMLKQNATGRSVQQLNRNRNGNRSRTDSLCTPAPLFRHCLGIPDWPLANVFSPGETYCADIVSSQRNARTPLIIEEKTKLKLEMLPCHESRLAAPACVPISPPSNHLVCASTSRNHGALLVDGDLSPSPARAVALVGPSAPSMSWFSLCSPCPVGVASCAAEADQ